MGRNSRPNEIWDLLFFELLFSFISKENPELALISYIFAYVIAKDRPLAIPEQGRAASKCKTTFLFPEVII